MTLLCLLLERVGIIDKLQRIVIVSRNQRVEKEKLLSFEHDEQNKSVLFSTTSITVQNVFVTYY